MTDGIERRFLAGGGVRLVKPARKAGDTIGTVEGYASVFDTLSHDLGGWRERIAPGAFADALHSPSMPILALYDHAVGGLLGSTAVGTLTLNEDTVGLRFVIDLPDTTTGRDVLALVTRGDLAGASFGFVPDRKATTWERTTAGPPVSVVKRVAALREVSIVALPAYPAAGVSSVTNRAITPQAARARAALVKMRQSVATG